MANMKTDDSGIITTEFYTGRCPVRCEMCFVNFGEGGSSVPFTIYSSSGEKSFSYATCQTTLERLREDKKPDSKSGVGPLDWVAQALCGPPVGLPGGNNKPRHWKPVVGTDKVTHRRVEFFSGMTKEDYKRILKPLDDQDGLYSIPKVPEAPWFRDVPATRTFNGQWLPSVLRVNSMSDSSVAPSEWIERIRDIWGDRCFFNTNVHAIKRYPTNLRAGLYHKVVVTANPGLQKLHPGLNRYKMWYPKKQDVVNDPEVMRVAREVYLDRPNLEKWLVKQPWEELYGLITLRLGAETMKGARNRRWHFFHPELISDIDPQYEQYEQNIKFYRVRALPTIQPHIDKFEERRVPVVFTVLRFKTVLQACEFANKYDLEIRCVVKSRKDEIVCNYYGVPCRLAEEGEESLIQMRDDSDLNGSPNRGQWSSLTYEHNFFRPGKAQMSNMQYVCDRASKSCKACGLCAMLDGTEKNNQNPILAHLGLKPQEYAKQDRYLCDPQGEPVATRGIEGRIALRQYSLAPVPKAINRTKEELDFFYGPGGKEFWNPHEAEVARKARERAAKRRENPSDDLIVTVDYDIPEEFGEPALAMFTTMQGFAFERQRNPDDGVLIEAMSSSLQLAVDYGSQGDGGPDDYWQQGWNTHEHVATMIAYVFWWLMVLAHNEGLSDEDAFDAASEFSYDSCGMDLFEFDFDELSLMYWNHSNWNDQFGPTH